LTLVFAKDMKLYCSDRYSWLWPRLTTLPKAGMASQHQAAQTASDFGRNDREWWRKCSRETRQTPREKRWKRGVPASSSRLKTTTSSTTTTATTTTTIATPMTLSSVVLYPLAGLLALLRNTTLHLIITIYFSIIRQLGNAPFSSKRFNVLKMVAHLGSTMVRAVRQAWAIFVLASLLHQTVVAEGAKGGFRCDSGGNQVIVNFFCVKTF
jgi:hypothetical protein